MSRNSLLLLLNHKMLFGEGSQAKRIPKAEVKNTLAFCVSVSFAVAASIIQHTTAGSTTDQSFVYHLKLVISRLPSQIPWWAQPCVTFSYCIVSCDGRTSDLLTMSIRVEWFQNVYEFHDFNSKEPLLRMLDFMWFDTWMWYFSQGLRNENFIPDIAVHVFVNSVFF